VKVRATSCDAELATVEETELPWLDDRDACVDPRESCELLDGTEERMEAWAIDVELRVF
jgi:hypothetical protein